MRAGHPFKDHDHGKAPHCRCGCLFFHNEITHDPISDLVFSLRSKRRFGEARVEAAHWFMRTSFGLQSGVSVPILTDYCSTVVHCCPVALLLSMTHQFNPSRAIVSRLRAQTGISVSCPILYFWSRWRDSKKVMPFFRWHFLLAGSRLL